MQLLLELGARTDVAGSLQEYYVATPLVSGRNISIAGAALSTEGCLLNVLLLLWLSSGQCSWTEVLEHLPSWPWLMAWTPSHLKTSFYYSLPLIGENQQAQQNRFKEPWMRAQQGSFQRQSVVQKWGAQCQPGNTHASDFTIRIC